MKAPIVSAAVLAGGASRRFGSDKALSPSPVDGRPLLESIVERVTQIADDVFIVAPPSRGYGRFGVPVVAEPTPGEGPLAAVVTALRTAIHPRCLVVACDLPFLNPILLRWMIGYPFDGDALVPIVPRLDGGQEGRGSEQRQSLHAIYDRSSLETARRLVDAGHRRLGDLLDAVRVTYVYADELRRIDPDLTSFVNLNVPSIL